LSKANKRFAKKWKNKSANPVVHYLDMQYIDSCLLFIELDMAKKHTIRSAWKQVSQNPQTAVFLFRTGIELLSLESEANQAQFNKMLKDFEIYLCGVYDANCSLAMFREDIEALSEQVALDSVIRKQLFKR
jgi:hypothetical protein